MRSHTLPPLLLLLLLLLPFTTAAPALGKNNYAAALCCGRGPRCSPDLARTSGYCEPGRWMSQQSSLCKNSACIFCRQDDRRFTSDACRWDAIYKNCFGGRKPTRPSSGGGASAAPQRPHRPPPRPRPPVAASQGGGNGGRCAWTARDGKVVIPATRLKIGSYWEKVGNAIVWKKTGGGGIDPKGSGAVCAKVRFNEGGVWYMTGVSSAPHPTEHNDAWFKFSGGLDLYRPQARSFRKGNNDWYKGYQNNGGNKPADYIVTIDHNGHQFLTKPVNKGQVYTVCVAGRSSRYSLFKIAFLKCNGGESCSRFTKNIKGRMQHLNPSRCY